MTADAPLRIVLVDDHPERALVVEQALHGCGFQVVSGLASASGLLFQIEQHRPRLVMIDLESPDRDILESLAVISAPTTRPRS